MAGALVMMRTLLLCAGISSALCSAASASCALSVETQTDIASIPYEPFSANDALGELRIRVENNGDESCEARLYARPIDGAFHLAGPGGAALDWRFGGNASSSAHTGEAGPFIAHVAGGDAEEIAIPIVAPAGQIVPRGAYTANLEIRAADAAGAPVDVRRANPSITADVSARVLMSISGVRWGPRGLAPAGIDFGELETGEIGRVFVNVWANSSVTVMLNSQNGGQMLNLENAALPGIDYSARFDGSVVSLASGATLQRAPPLRAEGASYELAVIVGDVSNRYAGRYQDIISVTVNEN